MRRMAWFAAVAMALACGGSVDPGKGDSQSEASRTSDRSSVYIPRPYRVGGAVWGLTGLLVLQNNLTDTLSVSVEGRFQFAHPIRSGSTYSVKIVVQPVGQSCTVSHGSGRVTDSVVTSVAVSCTTPPGPNQPPGTWSAAGSMSFRRARHTATLLNDGRVLVAGNDGTADLFTAGTNSFGSTSTMIARRDCCFTATLLGTGRVLVTGGGAFDALAAAEIWDPRTESWSAAASMHTARHDHTATLLVDGRVLVAGGSTDNMGTGTATAEIYDPIQDAWTETSSMLHARLDHTATLVSGGQVLVAGGANISNGGLPTAELYDPVSGTWSVTGSLITSRWGHAASLLNDGRVLIAGGCCGPSELTSSEIYDPGTATWSATSSTATPRGQGFTLVRLGDGTVLIAGAGRSSVERYDPSTGLWNMTGSMGTNPNYPAATRLADGSVLVTGGYTWEGEYLSTAEVYKP